LGNLSIVRRSRPSTDLDQLQQVRIGVDELLGHGKPSLKLSYLKVCVRRLGGDGNSSSNLLGLRSLQFVSGRGRAAAQASGKIDFPGRCGSSCVLSFIASIARETIRNGTELIQNALVHGCARRVQINGRQKLRTR
jgi:hypothetical protein